MPGSLYNRTEPNKGWSLWRVVVQPDLGCQGLLAAGQLCCSSPDLDGAERANTLALPATTPVPKHVLLETRTGPALPCPAWPGQTVGLVCPLPPACPAPQLTSEKKLKDTME